jgi:hypothetical protein
MNKVKIFLMILIIGTMAQQALAAEASFFHPGRILISAEYQSLLPSCNSYSSIVYRKHFLSDWAWGMVRGCTRDI